MPPTGSQRVNTGTPVYVPTAAMYPPLLLNPPGAEYEVRAAISAACKTISDPFAPTTVKVMSGRFGTGVALEDGLGEGEDC